MSSLGVEKPPAFVSLGMVVVDELRCPGRVPMLNIPGGSGAFSVLGARLLAGQDHANEVGCFILAGNDFPNAVLTRFKEWNVDLCVKVDATRPSTRGLLEYQDTSFSRKVFRYTTTPLQPTPRDLPPRFLSAAAFHLLLSPADVEAQVKALISLRLEIGQARPLLVWEPAPIHCSQRTRDAHLAAAKQVDVFSPNHLELMTFFKGPISEDDAETFDPEAIEGYADAFLNSGIGPDGKGTIVVRAGSHGCLVSSLRSSPRHQWLPAYSDPSLAIVDATGAGNTFLGAFTFSMAAHGKSPLQAAAFASVAATFSLEQIGLPALQNGSNQSELWNGAEFGERYGKYQSSLPNNVDAN